MDVGLVCDACAAFNELGVGSCGDCSAHLSLDESAPHDLGQEALGQDEFTQEYSGYADADADALLCTHCNTTIAKGNRFCGACGTPAQSATPEAKPSAPSGGAGKRTLFFSSIQAAKAKLVLIKGEGHDGESYALAGEDHRIGRSDADIVFEEDEFLSPTHANFFYVDGKLVVKDENSTNGVYLRIRDSCTLLDEDFLLVGEQVIQVRVLPSDNGLIATDDGTYLYCSPRRPARFELTQILSGGAEGIKYPATNDSITLGREQNDINFPEDPFISGHHAQVSGQGNDLTLTDLGSKNGTFIRLTKETPLSHGDYVFMGQQLLRVEIV